MEPFFYLTTQLLWLLDTKSEHSQAYIVLTWGLFGNSKRKSSLISMKKSLPPLR